MNCELDERSTIQRLTGYGHVTLEQTEEGGYILSITGHSEVRVKLFVNVSDVVEAELV